MFLPCDVCHIDPDLAVLNFAETTAPLLGDANRFIAFLGKRRWVEHDHSFRFAQLDADLNREGVQQRLMIPRHLSDEFLNSLPVLVVQVGNSFACLVLQSGHQAGYVLNGTLLLLGSCKALQERLQEKSHPNAAILRCFQGNLGLTTSRPIASQIVDP